jgi:2-polyprenyl-6-methoxyphenol hydroxylase-like FAD-dependent oxidoreductase
MARNGRAARGRAIVIGGSVGGLFAGNLLFRQGWDVDIYERANEGLASRGLGIAAHDELEALISAAGAAMPQPLGIEVSGRSAFDRTGRLIANFDFPQHLAAWTGVFNSLHAAFPSERYHNGWELVGIDAGETGSRARFANGKTVEADLVIGADGFRSTVRSVVAPHVNPRYAGYVAWRGVVEESALSSEFRAETISQFAFVFPRASEFIGYPVPGDDGSADLGRRRYNFLWYYPVSPGAALDDILTDDQGRLHDYSIPPPLIRAEHIENLKQHARKLLPAKFLEVFGAAKRYMVQPIYDVESERIGFDNVALIGDAGFVARPHVGVGVLKAGQDALELTKCLSHSSSVSAALELYQRTRADEGRKSVAAGRRLGAFIERGLDGPWTDPALRLSVQDIIRVSGRPVSQCEHEVHLSEKSVDVNATLPNQQQ